MKTPVPAFYSKLHRERFLLGAVALFIGLLSLPALAGSQTVDLEKDRVPMTELTGPWRFHTGDDPTGKQVWADSAFDDSGWSLLTTGKGWDEQGYNGYSGFAWYRLRISVPAQHSPLAFYLPGVEDSCQVFANGRLIGSAGTMPPSGRYIFKAGRFLFLVPEDTLIPQPLTIAIRTLAAESHSSAELLTRLNREMLRINDGGFITCLCARLSASGTLTFANAGHIPPYVNGRELACDYGLPLGILDAQYFETAVPLAPGDHLTLISDGVVEAQNTQNELYGFDRTAAITSQSAAEIARAAQAFGQEDDITVLTLTFAPVS